MTTTPGEPRKVESRSQICDRSGFAGYPVGGTCDDCGHLIMAHIGCESCVVCRMEYQLSPEWRRIYERINGHRAI